MRLTSHGLSNLMNTYGAEMIPVLFKQAVQESCDPFNGPGWTQGEFGAGIVNAEKLLDWSLPAPSSVRMESVAQELQVAPTPQLYTGGTPIFTQLFERQLLNGPNQPNILRVTSKDETLNLALAELLRCAPGEVPEQLNEVGQELAFHLAVNPQIYKAFARAIAARQVAIGGMVESGKVMPAISSQDVLATAGAGSIEQTRGELMTVGVSSKLGDILRPV